MPYDTAKEMVRAVFSEWLLTRSRSFRETRARSQTSADIQETTTGTVPKTEEIRNRHHKTLTHLLQAADRILDMAEDLRARGKLAESLAFALVAAQYVNAARSLERLEQVTLQ